MDWQHEILQWVIIGWIIGFACSSHPPPICNRLTHPSVHFHCSGNKCSIEMQIECIEIKQNGAQWVDQCQSSVWQLAKVGGSSTQFVFDLKLSLLLAGVGFYLSLTLSYALYIRISWRKTYFLITSCCRCSQAICLPKKNRRRLKPVSPVRDLLWAPIVAR